MVAAAERYFLATSLYVVSLQCKCFAVLHLSTSEQVYAKWQICQTEHVIKLLIFRDTGPDT